MNEKDSTKPTIPNLVKGGDQSDIEILDNVLHIDFRIINYGFMGTFGVSIIDKTEYLNKIKIRVFGGLPRQIKTEALDQIEKITSVKLRIESSENEFISYNSIVLDTDNQWMIINNLAVVEAKTSQT